MDYKIKSKLKRKHAGISFGLRLILYARTRVFVNKKSIFFRMTLSLKLLIYAYVLIYVNLYLHINLTVTSFYQVWIYILETKKKLKNKWCKKNIPITSTITETLLFPFLFSALQWYSPPWVCVTESNAKKASPPDMISLLEPVLVQYTDGLGVPSTWHCTRSCWPCLIVISADTRDTTGRVSSLFTVRFNEKKIKVNQSFSKESFSIVFMYFDKMKELFENQYHSTLICKAKILFKLKKILLTLREHNYRFDRLCMKIILYIIIWFRGRTTNQN